MTSGEPSAAARELIKRLLRLWAAPGPWTPGEAAEDGLTRVALPLVDAFAPNTTVPAIRGQLGESTYLAGGSLSAYPGGELTEHGFPLFPEGISVEVVNAAGTMTDGVEAWLAEWLSNQRTDFKEAASRLNAAMQAAPGRLRCCAWPTVLIAELPSRSSHATAFHAILPPGSTA